MSHQKHPQPERQQTLAKTNHGPPLASSAIHKGADLILSLIQSEKQRALEAVNRDYADLQKKHADLQQQYTYSFDQSARRRTELELEIQRLKVEIVHTEYIRELEVEREEARRVSLQAQNDLIRLAQVLDQYGIVARSGAQETFNVTLDDRWEDVIPRDRIEEVRPTVGEEQESIADGQATTSENSTVQPKPPKNPTQFLKNLGEYLERNAQTLAALKNDISLLQKQEEDMKAAAERNMQEANATIQLRDRTVKELNTELATLGEEVKRLRLISVSKPCTTQQERSTASALAKAKLGQSNTSPSNVSPPSCTLDADMDDAGLLEAIRNINASLKRPNKELDNVLVQKKKPRTSLDSPAQSPAIPTKRRSGLSQTSSARNSLPPTEPQPSKPQNASVISPSQQEKTDSSSGSLPQKVVSSSKKPQFKAISVKTNVDKLPAPTCSTSGAKQILLLGKERGKSDASRLSTSSLVNSAGTSTKPSPP